MISNSEVTCSFLSVPECWKMPLNKKRPTSATSAVQKSFDSKVGDDARDGEKNITPVTLFALGWLSDPFRGEVTASQVIQRSL